MKKTKNLIIYHFYLDDNNVESDFDWKWVDINDEDHEEHYYEENEMNIETAIDFFIVEEAIHKKDINK